MPDAKEDDFDHLDVEFVGGFELEETAFVVEVVEDVVEDGVEFRLLEFAEKGAAVDDEVEVLGEFGEVGVGDGGVGWGGLLFDEGFDGGDVEFLENGDK